MLTTRKNVWLMAITIALTACGEFSYKRGANVAQLENTRQTCQAKSSDVAIEKCMEDSGWTIQKLDSFEIFTETSVEDESQNDVQATEVASNLDSENTEKSSASQVVVADKPQQSNNTNTSKAKTKAAPSNPLDTHVVSSWWKTGVKPDAFKTDSNMCVEKLGEIHKPEGKTQTVTVGFITCMNEKGWKALKKLTK
ncbi:hypothetical protein [Methylotenera versatilis]|uniref:hypothetical protein n=1 Tax=Methylotenera versatilis TaxID=1055487 RepID=UPI000645C200|nr:hypothetical protein [Methylotenera versatilis]